MMIKGEYRDVLRKNGKVIEDRGWRSNKIVEDYGKFLAALMKKEDSVKGVGIEYMAVGNGNKDENAFKDHVEQYFHDSDKTIEHETYWVWAKQIVPGNIIYLKPNDKPAEADKITNKLQIDVTFTEAEPSRKEFKFKQFALLGINESHERVFFINFVDHGIITKDTNMKLTRTVRLTFPEGESNEISV